MIKQLLARKNFAKDSSNSKVHLERTLTTKDLIFMGVGVIIGSGIFITPGIIAANNAGPGVVFTYLIAALVCIVVAFCYSEFASAITSSGSVYAYIYTVFGEFAGWISGWSILLCYLFAESSIAVSWSAYFQNFLSGFGIKLPDFLRSAYGASGNHAGRFDLLAFLIVFLLTVLLLQGMKESITLNKILVYLKMFIIFLFIIVALFSFKPQNLHPLLPYGSSGLGRGASIAFFAYIGFDVLATASEEVKNPKRSVPIGIIASLSITAIIYSLVSFALVGAVKYTQLNVADPVSLALRLIHQNWIAGFVAIGAVLGMTTGLLVIIFGGTRLIFAISRDGLLPERLNNLNKNHIPFHSTLIFGLTAGLVAGFIPLDKLTELVNIGALLAFAVVCLGVVFLRRNKQLTGTFKTPGYPYVPIIGFLLCIYLIVNLHVSTMIIFLGLLIVGTIIYFSYGYRHSEFHSKKDI
ncbi:amino acid permease [Lactobacillus sp. YT155]|uniref:APC family permease n=1 Tax=Lactobacillus sp. YT155 TaxID=3060955 RepID=UPI00265ECFB0|nr:amino acid permease [Lactobacillus sp. YT155]MDO1604859.1 amino acid permease [Lactobacillus sp. YT155]